MPITYEAPELATNESLKGFDSPDALGKAYLELNGKASTGDISLLPEDLRKDPTVAKYKTVGDLAKGHIEASKLVGTIKHAPKDPSEYKFTQIQNLHAGISKGAPETQKFLAGLCHSLDIDGERADKLQQAVLTALSGSLQKQEEARVAKGKETETALRSKWGVDYDKNKQNVENVMKRIGLEDLVSVIGGDAGKLEKFHKLTSLLSEDSIGKLGENSNSSIDASTKEGAAKALTEFNLEVMKVGRTHAFYDDKNKDHDDVVKKYNKFFEVAYGT